MSTKLDLIEPTNTASAEMLLSQQNPAENCGKIEEATHTSEQQIRRLRQHNNELNTTNAKLSHALRAKDEFLANISHELRTPLNAILGKSEIMLEGIQGPLTEKQKSSLHIIEESGNHLLDLINDILDMARIEAGNIALEIQDISLANLSESSLQFVRQMAHKKQIKLLANIDHSVTTCLADERRLKQVLINLLSNAVKFTASGGEVGLNILNDPENMFIQFQVWDTGIGISRKDMGLLFKPFVQLDSGLSRSHEGTGLGLSLVYHLTEMHGGSVSLESQVGVGSCFTVTLPKTQYLDAVSLQKQAEADRVHYGNQLRHTSPSNPGEAALVLLGEKNESVLEEMQRYLSVWGYHLTAAYTVAEVVAQAQERKPDLVLLNDAISEPSSLTAVHQLRTEKRLAETPIVTLSSLAIPGDQERYLAAGVNAYLQKPIQLHQLALLIDKLLAKMCPGARVSEKD